MRPAKCGALLVLLVMPFCASRVSAQQVNAGTETGLPLYQTFSGSNFDQVNVQNGGIHISIPLLTIKERDGRKFVYKYIYDTPTYEVVWISNPSPSNKDNGFYQVKEVNDGSGNWRLSTPFSWSVRYEMATVTCPTTGLEYTYYNEYTLTDPNGTKHQVPIYKEGDGTTTACYGNDLSGPAEDGSGIIFNLQTNQVTLEDGTQINLNTDTLEDTNGNEATPTKDMLGRDPLTVTNGPDKTYTTPLGNTISQPSYTLWTYKDSNGNAQSYRVDYGAFDGKSEGCSNKKFLGYNCVDQSSMIVLLPVKITLPDNQTYQFSYQNDAQDELLQVKLPTGTTISYSGYANAYTAQPDTGRHLTYMGRRAVGTRTVDHDGASDVWTYSGGTVTDPLGDQTDYTFSRIIVSGTQSASAVQTSAEYYDSTGKLFKTVQKTWTGDVWSGPNETVSVQDLRVTSQSTTLGSVTSTVNTVYGATDSYGGYSVTLQEPTETQIYGYGGSLLRRTDYSYLFAGNQTYENLNMLDRVLSKKIYDGSGALDSETDYEYDNYTAAIQTPSAVQHNQSFGSGYTTRGNVQLSNNASGVAQPVPGGQREASMMTSETLFQLPTRATSRLNTAMLTRGDRNPALTIVLRAEAPMLISQPRPTL